MSARAASRLVSLGFTSVYRYQAGRADWFAAGLPREGTDAHIPRVADVAERDVETCRLDERIDEVRDRVGSDGDDPVIVLDPDRIVLGLVTLDPLPRDPATTVEAAMDSGPVTFRPNLRVGEMPEYFEKQGIRHALVTTCDGILVGLVHHLGPRSPRNQDSGGH